jgi:capsule polysaccharide export protein KpsC/LpsZ
VQNIVLIKINYGQIGDQKGSFIQQTQIIMGLRIFYPRYIKSSQRQSVDVEFRTTVVYEKKDIYTQFIKSSIKSCNFYPIQRKLYFRRDKEDQII